jgi:hypothetical protein
MGRGLGRVRFFLFFLFSSFFCGWGWGGEVVVDLSASVASCCWAYLRCCQCPTRDRLTPWAAMEPFPTTLRQVSGKNKTKTTRRTPEKTTRNQNVDLQPRN